MQSPPVSLGQQRDDLLRHERLVGLVALRVAGLPGVELRPPVAELERAEQLGEARQDVAQVADDRHVALTSFEISAGSMSMCTIVAFGAKRLSLPVTRSSKRRPAPRSGRSG
jgi:hypothetical protein